MNAILVVVIGNVTKRRVALQLPAVLGRSREADITVAHPLISRRHCEISETNGLLMLRDMASLNGTMIGGRRVESAPLLPDAEFTIGPLTFRVLYEYDGDLTSVPDTRFIDVAEGSTEAGVGDPTSAVVEDAPLVEVEEEEAVAADPGSESNLGELAMPDFMALADADPEEVLSAARSPAKQSRPTARSGPKWPPVADDKLPTLPMTGALEEPLEFDSSLQSGAHNLESPWAAEPRSLEKKPLFAPAVPLEPPPEQASAETVAKPPAKQKPPAAKPAARPKPPRKPTDSEEMDPEFGSFLEDLH